MRYITTWETMAEAVFEVALWKRGGRINTRTAGGARREMEAAQEVSESPHFRPKAQKRWASRELFGPFECATRGIDQPPTERISAAGEARTRPVSQIIRRKRAIFEASPSPRTENHRLVRSLGGRKAFKPDWPLHLVAVRDMLPRPVGVHNGNSC